MKKALPLGLLASFFFAFTFILNRSMHLLGGSWVWSASLRYLFTFPVFALLVWRGGGFSRVHGAIRRAPLTWLVWSTIGFGLFYAPISFAGDHGESWLIAASWQVTIVMGCCSRRCFISASRSRTSARRLSSSSAFFCCNGITSALFISRPSLIRCCQS